jgi:hypothetical protein
MISEGGEAGATVERTSATWQTTKYPKQPRQQRSYSYADARIFLFRRSFLMRLRCHFHLIWRGFFQRRELLFILGFVLE